MKTNACRSIQKNGFKENVHSALIIFKILMTSVGYQIHATRKLADACLCLSARNIRNNWR